MTLLTILRVVYIAFRALLFLVLGYHLILAIFGGGRRFIPGLSVKRSNRFALIISARNEERVIGNIIDSLSRQKYPSDKYDIYVIADNCTDDTARVAAEHGAIVYERSHPTKRSKGFALNWFFSRINEDMPGAYDAYGVFDADNIVDENYLSVMNRYLENGADILQGYRDMLNPSKSWVSGCYSIYFWYISRFFQRPRNTPGLSGIIGGTGFVFRSELVSAGWETSALTEDMEFTLQNALKGYRVQFAENAIFYDEQPTKFSQSIYQRYRWTLGNLQCMGQYSGKLLKRTLKKGGMKCWDLLLFLLMAPCSSIVAVDSFLGTIIRYFAATTAIHTLLVTDVVWVIVSIALMYLHGICTILCSGKKIKTVWRGLFLWPFFLFSWTYISLVALVYRNPIWKPIEHTGSSLSLEC